MIDLYSWSTPNGHKIAMALEELGLPYRINPIDITKGDQFKPDFLALSPNGRIPALVDHAPADGGAPITLFESNAILLYLAEKTGQLLSHDPAIRAQTLSWLFWQAGQLGPTAAETYHFSIYMLDEFPPASTHHRDETTRLFNKLDRHLADRAFITGDDYSIADIACYPWIVPARSLSQSIDDVPHLKRWRAAIAQRPGTARAYAMAKQVNPNFGRAMTTS
jgi:GST-like protein